MAEGEQIIPSICLGSEKKDPAFEELLAGTTPTLIFLRHASTAYSGEYPDINEKGEEQVKKTADILKPLLETFGKIIVIRSPRPRAQGTIDRIFQHLGRDLFQAKLIYQREESATNPFAFRTSKQARDTDVSDYGKWNSKRNSNSWFDDPAFQGDTVTDDDGKIIAEGRKKVRERFERMLRHYSVFIQQVASSYPGERIAMFIGTHWEIVCEGTDLVTPHQGGENPGPFNTEFIAFTVPEDQNGSLMLYARQKVVEFNLNK